MATTLSVGRGRFDGRLVTMANDAYAPGLAALLQSLVDHSGVDELAMTVVVDGVLSPHIRAALDHTGVDLEYVALSDLGYVPPRDHTRGRWRLTLQKMLLFRLRTAAR